VGKHIIIRPQFSFAIYMIAYCIFKQALKGPKCEIFGFGFFALIRPISIGDLGTRPKNY